MQFMLWIHDADRVCTDVNSVICYSKNLQKIATGSSPIRNNGQKQFSLSKEEIVFSDTSQQMLCCLCWYLHIPFSYGNWQ